MRQVTWARLRDNVPRLAAVSLAIILSVGFVVGALTLAASFKATVAQALTEQYQNADVVVRLPAEHEATAIRTVRDTPGVAGAQGLRSISTTARTEGHTTGITVTVLPDARLRWQRLHSGNWAKNASDITLDMATARAFDVHIGQKIRVDDPAADGAARTARIVGITQSSASVFLAGTAEATVTASGLHRLLPETTAQQATILVSSSGPSENALASSIRTRLDHGGLADALVQTGNQVVQQTTADITGGINVLLVVVLVFAVVALFVAALVIMNTFSVLLARRARELALLRCIGASTRQIRRSVYGEAFATGLAGSLVGVAVGYGLAALASGVSGAMSASPIHLAMPRLDPVSIGLGLALGTLVTVLAAIPPIRRAARVRPVEALRPAADLPVRSRRGVAQLVVAGLLLVGGGALLFAGAVGAGLVAGLPGGVICFTGVLLASRLLIPPAVRAVGVLVAFTGVPGRLAAANATRNPRRTAATASALLIGTTLIAMVVIGAGSVRTTLTHDLDVRRPVDMTVVAQKPLSVTQMRRVASLDGVEDTAAVTEATVRVDGRPVELLSMREGPARKVLHTTTLIPATGEIILNSTVAKVLGVRPGEPLEVGTPAHALLVAVSGGLPDGTALVAPETLRDLAVSARPLQLWLRTDPSLSASQVQQLGSRISAVIPRATVDGPAAQRAFIGQVIDTMMLVVIGLLAVAVIVAVVGVANTLALSVLERRRESALLRALGLTKGQLRAMLALEAILIAVVAALLGIAFGMFFGWAGTGAIFAGAPLDVLFVVPWGELALLTGVAVAAGFLASVLPARTAARLSPIAGMAVE